MVLGYQVSVEVYQPRADGVRAKRCNEDQRPVSTELNQSRRTSTCGFPCIVFVNKAQFSKGRQPIGNDSSAVFAGLFNGETRVRTIKPNQRQDFSQTGYDRLLGSRSLAFVFCTDSLALFAESPPEGSGWNDLSRQFQHFKLLILQKKSISIVIMHKKMLIWPKTTVYMLKNCRI